MTRFDRVEALIARAAGAGRRAHREGVPLEESVRRALAEDPALAGYDGEIRLGWRKADADEREKLNHSHTTK